MRTKYLIELDDQWGKRIVFQSEDRERAEAEFENAINSGEDRDIKLLKQEVLATYKPD